MPRKQSGSLVWMPSGWHCRYYATVEGERKYVFESLGTKNEVLARQALLILATKNALPRAAETRSDDTAPSEAALSCLMAARVAANRGDMDACRRLIRAAGDVHELLR